MKKQLAAKIWRAVKNPNPATKLISRGAIHRARRVLCTYVEGAINGAPTRGSNIVFQGRTPDQTRILV
jgi:hypothetical protein